MSASGRRVQGGAKSALGRYAQFPTMHRSPIFNRADAAVVRRQAARASTKLDIVSALARTVDPTFADHHEYRARYCAIEAG